MASGTIKENSDTLQSVARTTSDAGSTLSSSTAALSTAVPSGAFGVLGEAVVAAANSTGAGIGGLLSILGRLADTSAQGTSAMKAEFERIEEAAVARFRTLQGEDG